MKAKKISAMRYIFVLTMFAYFLVACGQKIDGSVSIPQVVNGFEDSYFRGVGRLEVGHHMCTATLIGRQTILTAAHCIRYPQELPGGYFWLFSDNESLPEIYRPMKAHNHPGYVHRSGVPDQVGLFDIAIVKLDRVVVGIEPYAISTMPPMPSQKIELVGFGDTNDDDTGSEAGKRRRVDNVVSDVRPMTFVFVGEKNIWYGDSGGPTFANIHGQDVVIGNHSGGAFKKYGMDMRVDYFCSWLVQAAEGDISLFGGECPDYSPADGGVNDSEMVAASLPTNLE